MFSAIRSAFSSKTKPIHNDAKPGRDFAPTPKDEPRSSLGVADMATRPASDIWRK